MSMYCHRYITSGDINLAQRVSKINRENWADIVRKMEKSHFWSLPSLLIMVGRMEIPQHITAEVLTPSLIKLL